MTKNKLSEKFRDPKVRLAAIQEVIMKNADVSCNEHIRLCHKEGLFVNRSEMVGIRNKLLKQMDRAVGDARTVVADLKGKQPPTEIKAAFHKAAVDSLYDQLSTDTLPFVAVKGQKQTTMMLALEKERERKQKLQAEREAKQAAAAAERQAKWDAERSAEKPKEQEQPVGAEEKPLFGGIDGAAVQAAVADAYACKVSGAPRTLPTLSPAYMVGRSDSLEGRTIRRKWLEDWYMAYPRLTSGDGQTTLTAVFGISIDQTVICEVLETVRELRDIPYQRTRRDNAEKREQEKKDARQAARDARRQPPAPPAPPVVVAPPAPPVVAPKPVVPVVPTPKPAAPPVLPVVAVKPQVPQVPPLPVQAPTKKPVDPNLRVFVSNLLNQDKTRTSRTCTYAELGDVVAKLAEDNVDASHALLWVPAPFKITFKTKTVTTMQVEDS